MISYRNVFVAVILAAIGVSSAHACSVPVFRYALERWRPEPYEAVVYYRDSLSNADSSAVALLQNAHDGPHSANLYASLVNVNDSLKERTQSRWDSVATQNTPLLTLYAGRYGGAKPLWKAGLSREAAEKLLNSPIRKEISRRILAGETAVWVVIPSGDRQKDRAVMDTLRTSLRKLEGTLKLPEPDYDVSYFEPSVGVPLKIAFSTLVLSPTDPSEEVLLGMVFNGRVPDSLPDPLVIPFTGRGRALITVEGPKVKWRTVREVCRFLTGPCACTVKNANPGTDMLFSVDWDRALHSRPQAEPLPPLTGLSKFAEADSTARAEQDAAEAKQATADEPQAAAPVSTSVPGEGTKKKTAKKAAPAEVPGIDSTPSLACPVRTSGPADTGVGSDTTGMRNVLEEMLLEDEEDTVEKPASAGAPILRNLGLVLAIALLVVLAASAVVVIRRRSGASG